MGTGGILESEGELGGCFLKIPLSGGGSWVGNETPISGRDQLPFIWEMAPAFGLGVSCGWGS
jgi:hypothetical protein